MSQDIPPNAEALGSKGDASDALFDLKDHAQRAAVEYLRRRGYFEDLASVVKRILDESLATRGIVVHSVQARAKTAESFARKAEVPSEVDRARPKYLEPLIEITDLSGVRVITYLPNVLAKVDGLVNEQFIVVERSDKGVALRDTDRFGYQSIHYLVRLNDARIALPEYAPYKDAITEIQVRTVLQHAWAEIEHDIQYKSSAVIPSEIRRRFMSLAGLLELADREFQSIQDADKELTENARTNVERSQLSTVEITPDALKTYLNKKLGSDARIAKYSYDWEARLLKRLGFSNLEQVDECIKPYDDDRVNRAIIPARQGQTTRFEFMLLAGMGETYVKRHLWAHLDWNRDIERQRLDLLMKAEIPIGTYDPLSLGEPS
jgi:putative GTP pyrophosphokinase